jgi:competence ComEA-like helix-hairpin-helix protein
MFNLTKQERQAALFIFTVAIAGLGINYFLKIQRQPRLLDCFDKNLGKLDLNAAETASLMKLDGVGEKLCARILEYRRSYGGFRQVEELRNIKGMSESRFNKLKDLVFVRD